MHWRIILEAVDPTGDEYSREFLIDKDLDGLADGNVGCSIDDGKAIETARFLPRTLVLDAGDDFWIGDKIFEKVVPCVF